MAENIAERWAEATRKLLQAHEREMTARRAGNEDATHAASITTDAAIIEQADILQEIIDR